MTREDWAALARVLRAGADRTRGIQEPGTVHLGSVLRAMAGQCDEESGLVTREELR